MADNYFDFVGKNAGEEKKETPQETQALANVTVRADADCFLLCDGEYLDIQLEAGKLTKIQVSIGQHLLEFIYTEDANIKVEKVVDFPEAGKSYLVLVQELKAAINVVAEEAKRKAEEKARRKAAEEAKRKAEEEAKRKAEAEAKRKAKEEEKRKAAEEAKRKAEEKAKRKEEEKKRKILEKNFSFSTNVKKAMIDKEIRPAADLGNASAQFVLGKCYDLGQGVRQDAVEAVKWYRKAAEQGNSTAQYNLGNCYYNGQGVQQDYAEAVKWYKMAAEHGNHWAQFSLANCYKDAKGVHFNIKLAKKWYSMAAEQGNDEAKKILQKWA